MQRLIAIILFLSMIMGNVSANIINVEATEEIVQNEELSSEVLESTEETIEETEAIEVASEVVEEAGETPAEEVPALALAPTSFDIDFATVDVSTTYTEDDIRYYWTANTKGANWRVNSGTNADLLGSKATRIYPFNAEVSSTLYKTGRPFILDFTAPTAGYYDVSWDVVIGEKYGYADVYVNDLYVGTMDGYIDVGIKEQKLQSVYLNSGEYANTIKLVAKGKSHENGHFYFGFYK